MTGVVLERRSCCGMGFDFSAFRHAVASVKAGHGTIASPWLVREVARTGLDVSASCNRRRLYAVADSPAVVPLPDEEADHHQGAVGSQDGNHQLVRPALAVVNRPEWKIGRVWLIALALKARGRKVQGFESSIFRS